MNCDEWVAHHRGQGHNPHRAPTNENPEQWLCKCDPDATWTAVWRILTREQIMQKFAHLSKRPTPAREAHAALRKIDHSHIPPLRIAERYAGGTRRKPSRSSYGVIGDTGVVE